MNIRYHLLGRWAFALAFVGLAGSAGAQAPQMGDPFIFFHNQINPLIPSTSGLAVETDPVTEDPDVRVVHFYSWNLGYNQAQPGFHWPNNYVDMTENIARGDTLYMRFMSDPANVYDVENEPLIRFHFIDAEQLNGDGTPAGDNMAMRLAWYIPDMFHDGEWHEVAIPLPPPTRAELLEAQAAADVNNLIWGWDYYGAWNSEANTFVGPEHAEFQEFEWDAVQSFGPWWDYAPGGLGNTVTAGPIYIDYLYVGSQRIDLDAGTLPGAVSGVTVQASAPGVNTITVTTPVDDAQAYRVYASSEPITDVAASSVAQIGSIPADAAALTVTHTVYAADPNDPMPTVYYAVTTVGATGDENPDVSQSTASAVTNAIGQPYAFQVENEQAVLDAFLCETFCVEPFPYLEHDPIILRDRTAGADDIQGHFWVGFSETGGSASPKLYVYAEVYDDELSFAAPSVGAGDAWQFDSFELVWGTYDVAPIAGSTHGGLGTGEEPDYFIRINPRSEMGGSQATSVTVGAIESAEAQFDFLRSEAGDTVGYRVFAYIPTDDLGDEETAQWTPPGDGEVRFHPFSLIINDRDAGSRQHNPNWSADWPGFGTGWWENPSMWRVIAFAGRDYVTTSADEAADVPVQFSLGQAYPNPFNPATTIQFDLQAASEVRLAVFNVLGQEVAVLIDGQAFPAGTHQIRFEAGELTSGVYFYRLDAGGNTQTRSVTLLK